MKLSLAQILELESGKTLTLEGEPITLADVEIRRAPKGTASQSASPSTRLDRHRSDSYT